MKPAFDADTLTWLSVNGPVQTSAYGLDVVIGPDGDLTASAPPDVLMQICQDAVGWADVWRAQPAARPEADHA